MAEQIGLMDAAGTTATDPDPTVNDGDAFCATGSPGTPFIHGRDYVVDASTYRHRGTPDHSQVTLTYRLWGEPIKDSGTLPTGNTTSGSPTIASLSFTNYMQVGMRITGPGIPADTFISAINTGASTLVMTRAATATATGITLAINSVFVGRVRQWKFIRQMLGFPYLDTSSGQAVLRRNLPEPLRWSANQWQFVDRRPFLCVTADTHSNTTLDNIKRIINGVSSDGAVSAIDDAEVYGPGIPAGTTVASVGGATTVTLSAAATATAANQKITFIAKVNKTRRWTHWCTSYQLLRGIAPKAQKPEVTSSLMYPFQPEGCGPEPAFGMVDIDFTFEDVPYEPRIVSDPAVGGEYSRYTIYPEEASARLLQIRGSVKWNETSGDFGQPSPWSTDPDTGNAVTGVTFGGKEGMPKTIGENVFTWKWLDVPMWAYDWDAIQAHFGQINSTDFGSTLVAPFYVMPKECALFETAQRYQKNNVHGEPLWDIVFYFRQCCLDDRKGYWNRLYNNLGYPQRYKVGNQDFFKSFDFADLFKPYGQW